MFYIIFFYSFDFSGVIDQNAIDTIENSSSVAANTYAGLGAIAIIPAFIENFIANGVAEELFYRGFLCKRFCNKWGATFGIILQAVLFGLMHNILFVISGMDVGIAYHLFLFGFTSVGALLLGFLNEKIFNGSIIPSIILHGLGNFIATMLVAFNL